MKTTFRNGLPEGWKDHGVLTEDEPQEPKARRDKAQARVRELQSEKADVDRQLTAMLEIVRGGSADSDDSNDLTRLAERSARLTKELKAAELEAQSAENVAWTSAQVARRQKFAEVTARASQQREEFQQLFRQTCLALGTFCASVDAADELMRASATSAGTPGDMAAVVRELTTNLDPAHLPTNCKLESATSYGWNISFPVTPLTELRKEKQ